MISLPDVNVWLALAVERHVHHSAAEAWFLAQSPDSCAFCRTTQQGFLRLMTNPKALAESTVALSQAWRIYDELFADPRVVFADEPGGLEKAWREYNDQTDFFAQSVE